MKNRPLLSVCLMVLCIIASMVVWGRERFIKELRPSPIERYAAEGDNITICGKNIQARAKRELPDDLSERKFYLFKLKKISRIENYHLYKFQPKITYRKPD